MVYMVVGTPAQLRNCTAVLYSVQLYSTAVQLYNCTKFSSYRLRRLLNLVLYSRKVVSRRYRDAHQPAQLSSYSTGCSKLKLVT